MIYGDRIRFRPAERSDLPLFIGWLNDPEVRYGIAQYLPMSQAREEEWFESMIKHPPAEQVLVIEVRDTAKPSEMPPSPLPLSQRERGLEGSPPPAFGFERLGEGGVGGANSGVREAGETVPGTHADSPLINSQEHWTPIGTCSFMDIDWRSRNAEFGILIGEKAYWNKGFGTEAVKLLVRHGFQTLNLHRIWLRVFATNPRAVRAYEKAGFSHEGTKRQAEFIDGEYVDVLLMSILQPEWKQLSGLQSSELHRG